MGLEVEVVNILHICGLSDTRTVLYIQQEVGSYVAVLSGRHILIFVQPIR